MSSTILTQQELCDALVMSSDSDSDMEEPKPPMHDAFSTYLPASPSPAVVFSAPSAVQQEAAHVPPTKSVFERKYAFTPMGDSGSAPVRRGCTAVDVAKAAEAAGLTEKIARIKQRAADRESQKRTANMLIMPATVKYGGRFRKHSPPMAQPKTLSKSGSKNPFRSALLCKLHRKMTRDFSRASSNRASFQNNVSDLNK